MMRVLSSKERRDLIVLQSCGHHGQAKDHHHERDSSPSTISTTEKYTHKTMKKSSSSSSSSHHHHKQPKEAKTGTLAAGPAPEEDEDVSSTSHTSSTCSSSQSSQAAPQQRQQQQQQQSVFELTKLMEMKSSLHHHKDKMKNNDSKKAKKHTKKNAKHTGKASMPLPSIHEHGGDNENEKTTETIERPMRNEKKSVSFYRKVKVRKISSHRRYTLEERDAQWYSEDDYVQIKNECCFMVRKMMQVQRDEKKRQERLARGSNVKRWSWRTKKTTKTVSDDDENVTGTTGGGENRKDDYDSDESYDEFECYEDDEEEEQELRNDADGDNGIEKVWRVELETADQTIRGLENKTPHRANARQRKKIDVVWSVLDVQDHQIQKRELERSSERDQQSVLGGGGDDEDAAATTSDETTTDFEFHDRLSSLLSQVYVACNWKCRLDARRRGMQDEFCADTINQPVEHHQRQSQQHALSA
mmetsp:Transcript_6600/g.16677  ORF Transcript_6600/g.16677 Transcript_6600/m.16677 type:complete len:472 (+) Transcript_6600:480-1895(+)|eukprot:CAMPEP_0113476950 /NCGR_PEP_ID=MMETSP0014_2-20120614/19944_1 /TAXON_ID=2857 /ORGANISM="Nitzschia sp." /LENGTH=471 /DNA_ID=CAMNT_0000370005 /DNA_START=439 /DNA_END=1854 /DNA_ORIENTATION=+ /assembly_acc=CAM_ASM_000159